MPDGFTVDASSLEEVARKFKQAAHDAKPEVMKELAVIGEEHKKLARELAGKGSTSIPPTIDMRMLPDAVELTAAGTALAWVYERGNKDRRRGKTFHHPTFGHDPQVDQPRYPFFKGARARLAVWTVRRLVEAWRRGLKNAGINPE